MNFKKILPLFALALSPVMTEWSRAQGLANFAGPYEVKATDVQVLDFKNRGPAADDGYRIETTINGVLVGTTNFRAKDMDKFTRSLAAQMSILKNAQRENASFVIDPSKDFKDPGFMTLKEPRVSAAEMKKLLRLSNKELLDSLENSLNRQYSLREELEKCKVGKVLAEPSSGPSSH